MNKIVILLCVLFEISLTVLQAATLKDRPRVCVIGAGVGGLASARHLKEAGIEFVVLEYSNDIGGTWRYEERVGTNEYDLPILTSMYKTLRTNLPKVAMELPGFPFPDDAPSFPPWNIYYDYLKAFARHFGLEKYIKLLHQATLVKREGSIWKVKYEHVPTGNRYEEEFDYVMVASGHFSVPNLPNIVGENIFKGKIIHSHDYRMPETYACKRVLVIGAGPSGLDIGIDVAKYSKVLVHSHHSRVKLTSPYPSNYIMKPDVKELNETGAIFVDGSYEDLDDIIYATGYKYSYPFLDESSGLTITKKTIMPLHKLVLNINQPTMFMIGLISQACLVIAIDAQARYATSLIKGNFRLPSREDMMDDLQKYSADRPLSQLYVLGKRENQYYAALSEESGIEKVKPVLSKIHKADLNALFDNLYTFRNYIYTVLDDETFRRTTIEEAELPFRNVSCPNVL